MVQVRFTVDTAVQNVSVLQTALPDWVHQCLFNTKGVPFGDRGKVGSMKVVLVARGDVAPDEARLPSTSSGYCTVCVPTVSVSSLFAWTRYVACV